MALGRNPAVPVNLGTGIPLDMLLGDPEVSAVSAGPVWTGGGYWTADGVGYWTGPTLAAPAIEIVVRYTQPDGSTRNIWGAPAATYYLRGYAHSGGDVASVVHTASAWAAAVGTGNHTAFFSQVPQSGGWSPRITADGASEATTTAYRTFSAAAYTLYVGALSNSTPAVAGLLLWDVTVYQRALTPTERTNIYAAGVQTNPLTIAADAFACWDFANAYDNGGTPTVPDLVLGDGTRDLIGTSVDIGSDITTGATF